MFWLAVVFLGLGGYMLFSVSEGIGFGGKPTPTKAGADPPSAWGPQLRKVVGLLTAKMKAAGAEPDGRPNPAELDWRTVTFLFQDERSEVLVKSLDILPYSVDADGGFYHFATKTKPDIKAPKWTVRPEQEEE
jgi:hypothetical protein